MQFVVDFYEQVIKPLDSQMTTKGVISELLKPYTKTKAGSMMDSIVSGSSFLEQPNIVFISHCHDSAFVLLVESLKDYFNEKSNKWSEIFLLIDLFAIDQNKTTGEFQDQLRRSSTSVLVVIKDKAYPAEELMDNVSTYLLACLSIICMPESYLCYLNSILRPVVSFLRTHPAPHRRIYPQYKSCLASAIHCSS